MTAWWGGMKSVGVTLTSLLTNVETTNGWRRAAKTVKPVSNTESVERTTEKEKARESKHRTSLPSRGSPQQFYVRAPTPPVAILPALIVFFKERVYEQGRHVNEIISPRKVQRSLVPTHPPRTPPVPEGVCGDSHERASTKPSLTKFLCHTYLPRNQDTCFISTISKTVSV